MWAVVSASVTGTSHEAANLPCQDACNFLRLICGGEEVLVAAVADGAGSASHSQIGSKEAVQFIVKTANQHSNSLLCDLDCDRVRNWFELVLEHLKNVAVREAVTLGDLACTLLLGIVWRNGAVFSQIGDGAWIIEKDGEIAVGTWPQTGEYANVTVFVTTEGAINNLQFRKYEGVVSAVAGFTDGLQTLALDYSGQTPFTRFFKALLAPLRNNSDETELIAPLQQMLSSKLITARTDDDKTIILAAWREPQPVTQSNGPAE